MNKSGIKYEFSAKPWRHKGDAGWYFASLPIELAKEIRDALRFEEQGWGRLPATVKIGSFEWKTAIWFDTKRKTYLLPLKAEIRSKEGITTDKAIQATVWI